MIKNAIKQFFIYGIGSIAQTGLSFILIPVFLHYFEPSEYGIISLYSVTISLLSLLINAGLISGLFRLYYEAKSEERKILFGTTWIWYFLSAVFLGTIFFIIAESFSKLMFHTSDYISATRLVSILIIVISIQSIPLNILRMERKASLYVVFSLLLFIIDFSLKLVFIIIFKRGIIGYFESSILSNIIVLLSLLPIVKKYISLSLNRHYLGQLLRLGLPFVFSGLSIWVLGMADRMILNLYWGSAVVGVYSLGYSFANLFNIFLSNPSSLVWQPFFFSYAAEKTIEKTNQLLSKSLLYFFIAGAVLFLGICLGINDILKIITSLFGAKEGYNEAAKIVPIIALSPFLYLLCRPSSNALLLAKKPEFTAMATSISAAIYIGLDFLLIPKFGLMGAAITSFIAYALNLAILLWCEHRIWPINYKWGNLAKGAFFRIGLLWYWKYHSCRSTVGIIFYSRDGGFSHFRSLCLVYRWYIFQR